MRINATSCYNNNVSFFIMKKSDKVRLIISTILMALTILLVQLVKYSSAFYNAYHNISRKLIDIIAFFTSFSKYAVWQYILIMLILLFLYGLLKVIIKHKGFINLLTKIVLVISIITSFMTVVFFSNHYQPSLANQLNETIYEYNEDQLYSATEYYLLQAKNYVYDILRGEDGTPIRDDFTELAIIAGKSYANLNEEVFSGNQYQVKEVNIFGNYLLYCDIVGIFMPLTCEASIPSNIDNVSICFSMVHEVAHRKTIASEQDANYAAFLACVNNDDARFIYSGYYMAFRFCFSSLRNANSERANALIKKYNEDNSVKLVFQDYNYYIDYYKQFDSKLAKIADKANDTYLKLFDQKDGVLSYGNVTDNLVTYYINSLEIVSYH